MRTALERTLAISIALLLLLTIAIAMAPSAVACSCAQQTIDERAANYSIAFVGREVERVEDARSTWPTVAVTFEVLASHKGEVASTVIVFTGHGGGDCGVGPVGTALVGIFASESDGALTIDSCGSVAGADELAAAFGDVELPLVGNPTEPLSNRSGLSAPVVILGVLAVLGIGVALAGRRRRT